MESKSGNMIGIRERHIIPISGKDSLATAIVQREAQPDLEYEYMFNPTGSELPCVFDWLKKCETFLGKKIVRVGSNLEEIIKKNNYFLPSRLARYCTRQSKIEPMVKWIGSDDCEVYFGIRYDEDRKGFNNIWSPNISCNYPLKEFMLGIDDVYRIINDAGLKPPSFFWKSMYDMVISKLGYDCRNELKEWVFDPIFAWRTRANCYHCFNQRQYEIVGLWEHYPELAEKAAWYEKQGSSKKSYTWNDKPFEWYRDNAESIKEKRARKIIKIIQMSKQLRLFDLASDNVNDVFKITSCGLLCGK